MSRDDSLTERIAALAAAGQDAAAIGQAVGLSRRQVWRYLTRPDVQARIRQHRQGALDRAMGALADRMPDAVAMLDAIARDPLASPAARVSACRAILEMGLRVREALDIEARIAALEARLLPPAPRST